MSFKLLLLRDLTQHELKAAYAFEKGALTRWVEEVDMQILPNQKTNTKIDQLSIGKTKNYEHE